MCCQSALLCYLMALFCRWLCGEVVHYWLHVQCHGLFCCCIFSVVLMTVAGDNAGRLYSIGCISSASCLCDVAVRSDVVYAVLLL